MGPGSGALESAFHASLNSPIASCLRYQQTRGRMRVDAYLVIVVDFSTKDVDTQVLDGIDDIENGVFRHVNFKTGFDHVPKRF